MTRKQLHLSTPRFSHLGVPTPAGMSDCYESMSLTQIRDEWFPPPNSSFRRKPESRGVAGVGEPRSVGACSQPRIQHPANLMLLCGGAKAKGDSGMWYVPCP